MRFLIPHDFMEDPVRGIICVAFRLWIVAVVVALLASIVKAEPARVVRIIDGDSIVVEITGTPTTLRVTGLDTPETWQARCSSERQRGDAATAFARELMPPGKWVDVQLTGRLDKYGRALGSVTVNGEDYARTMITRGLGVAYNGGKRRDWCK